MNLIQKLELRSLQTLLTKYMDNHDPRKKELCRIARMCLLRGYITHYDYAMICTRNNQLII